MADVIILPTAAAVPPPRPERQAEAKAEAKAAEREAATAVHLKALRDPAIFTDFSGLTTQQKFNMLQLRHCEITLLIADLRAELGIKYEPRES
jgi:hypothetical protein